MFEIILKALEFLMDGLPEGISSYKSLGKSNKKRALQRLVRVYETLETLEWNVKEIIGYTDSFIKWIENDEKHTLENYCGSIKNIQRESLDLIEQLLKYLEKKSGSLTYLKLIEEDNMINLSIVFSSKRALLAQHENVRLIQDNSKGKTYQNLAKDLDERNKIVKYFLFSENKIEDSNSEKTPRIGHDKKQLGSFYYSLKSCDVENMEDLILFRENLLRIHNYYRSFRKSIKGTINENFKLEEIL